MKLKNIALSLLFVSVCVTLNAQSTKDNYYTPKWSDNIFVSVGGGVYYIYNDGFVKGNPHFNVSLGKLITPTWGVRAQVNGAWTSLCQTNIHHHKHHFIGANIDGLLNLSTLFAGVNTNRVFEVFAFLGPQMNISKSDNGTLVIDEQQHSSYFLTNDGHAERHTRIGASAGLGLKFNLNRSLALDIEARGSIAPSNFGNVSDYRKSEGTGALTVGLSYIFGGKKFNKVSDRVVEKEVVREVVREVPKEVIKEVIKETGKGAIASAVFFKINRAELSEQAKVNIKLIAEAMKQMPDAEFTIGGFADKATGTPAINQRLSEKRAQVVYDALVAEGVNPNQLTKVANGGTDNMFGKNYLNRVVIMRNK